MEKYTAFVMSYFTERDEALHLAYGYDGLYWSALNDNKPVLQASMGTKRVRDPYLYRKQDGTFVAVATQGWSTDSLYMWDSKDLVTFSNERLVKVNDTDQAWAPEIAFDTVKQEYVVYWSASGAIYCNTTKDFVTVSSKAKLFDPGYSVIDASITQWKGVNYMFFKDERGCNDHDTPYKAIKMAASATLEPGSFTTQTPSYITDHLVEGPFVLKSPTKGQWYLYYDYFMRGGVWGVSYTDDLAGGAWTKLPQDEVSLPRGVRHGNAFQVTASELQGLLAKWGPKEGC